MITFVLVFAVIFAAASGEVQLDVQQADRLEGIFTPTGIATNYRIKFEVAIENNEVASSSNLMFDEEAVPFVSLKIPIQDKDHRIIDHMRARVLLSARRTAEVHNSTENIPPLAELVTCYNKLADELNNLIPEKNGSQIFYMILYHSTVVSSALRIASGAREDSEICKPSPIYTVGGGVFVCQQDDGGAIPRKVADIGTTTAISSKPDDGKTRNKKAICFYYRYCPCRCYWRCYWYCYYCYYRYICYG
jgi:hypothetical protein